MKEIIFSDKGTVEKKFNIINLIADGGLQLECPNTHQVVAAHWLVGTAAANDIPVWVSCLEMGSGRDNESYESQDLLGPH